MGALFREFRRVYCLATVKVPDRPLLALHVPVSRRGSVGALDVEATWPQTYIPPEIVALVPDALGDSTAMYRWLERGVQVRSGWAFQLGVWKNLFASHRQEAHFRDIQRRIGVPEGPR